MKHILSLSMIGIGLFLTSCNSSDKEQVSDSKRDSLSVNMDSASVNKAVAIPETPGIIGVYDIPEMLTLAKKDSATGKDISFKIAKVYELLEQEKNATGAEMGGAPGALYYTNTPDNFVFEAVLPIKRLPAKNPTRCNVVVLESGKMVVYNHYGTYMSMFQAYEKLKVYLKENKLEQIGVAREFYITDPMLEKDSTKWLSRIFIPVK
ncbi:MAG: GyrI-like domain-containing protein [Sediminibacterium sp.]|nr:GyrI-like domain-containing protein [Sediminibacterium sp.]